MFVFDSKKSSITTIQVNWELKKKIVLYLNGLLSTLKHDFPNIVFSERYRYYIIDVTWFFRLHYMYRTSWDCENGFWEYLSVRMSHEKTDDKNISFLFKLCFSRFIKIWEQIYIYFMLNRPEWFCFYKIKSRYINMDQYVLCAPVDTRKYSTYSVKYQIEIW